MIARLALSGMLLFSSLPAAPMSKMYGQVFHQNGRPAANVTLQVEGGSKTVANGMGIYTLGITPGKHTVTIGATRFEVRIFDKPRNRRDFRIP